MSKEPDDSPIVDLDDPRLREEHTFDPSQDTGSDDGENDEDEYVRPME